MNEQEKAIILRKIESLQQSREYADEVESVRYSAKIQRLLRLLDSAEEEAA